ncbi:MAG: ABC transporter ATP-binding protein [Thaumarchaeota archaeon]|nr:ABC transporter ATP-binding protein [Nitrososphaerota archaeon]
MGSKLVISLENVSKSYNGSSDNVFEKVNLKIESGELLVAHGPIGSGKTTLLNLISGLTKPTKGQIQINGLDLGAMGNNRLAEMRARTFGIVHQTQNLIPELTIVENIELPLVFLGIGKEERRKRATEILRKIGITKMAERLVGNLSVGEREIVAIARSMIGNPAIVLMDEPTEALDPIMAEMVLSLIRGDSLLRKKTIIITTHDRRIASIAGRVIHIKRKIP